MPLADWIAAHARRTPARVAVRFEDQTLSYGELAARCEQIAGALCAAGVARGERVAWLGLSCPAMLAALFACARLGAIFMPLNWRLAPAEHKAMLHDCLPAVLCADDDYAAASAAAGIAPAGTRCVARSAPP
ncbi:MAG: AMP-binding protein, partial [Rubrivivax sp.]|nr:AMP-binding protein [Rubrivivax sp.]